MIFPPEREYLAVVCTEEPSHLGRVGVSPLERRYFLPVEEGGIARAYFFQRKHSLTIIYKLIQRPSPRLTPWGGALISGKRSPHS